ncbi:hypothetical protein SSPIM334S_07607 [Streptomyces spiroverticillatus]
MPTRRIMPPERDFTFASIRSARPTRSTTRSTAPGTDAAGISFSHATYATNSRTVNPG